MTKTETRAILKSWIGRRSERRVTRPAFHLNIGVCGVRHMFDDFLADGSVLDEFDFCGVAPPRPRFNPQPGSKSSKRIRKQPSGASIRKYLRLAAINTLGGVCCKCGFDNPVALDIDHVNNDGAIERRELTPCQIYRKVIKDVSGYQCLCANCHRIKTHEHLAKRG